MHKKRGWRDILGEIIADPQQKQVLASRLGVSGLTVQRWASGESQPRVPNLKLLIEALPQHRAELIETIEQEHEGFVFQGRQEIQKEIPASFYARVLNTHATDMVVLRAWSICSLILQQALGQLDPYQLGLAIAVVQCMPPSGEGNYVRSLRKYAGMGTGVWSSGIEQKNAFLGAESLAGYVVATGRQMVIQDIDKDQGRVPRRPAEGERSCSAAPITRASSIVGCFLISSTQPAHFTPERSRLIQHYADLLSLAFEPEAYYRLEEINLRRMPSPEIQESYFKSFQQRIAVALKAAARAQRSITFMQAEQIVWQQLEEELLQIVLEEVEAGS